MTKTKPCPWQSDDKEYCKTCVEKGEYDTHICPYIDDGAMMQTKKPRRTVMEWLADSAVDCFGRGKSNLVGIKGFHGAHALVVTMYFMVINTHIGLGIGGLIMLADTAYQDNWLGWLGERIFPDLYALLPYKTKGAL